MPAPTSRGATRLAFADTDVLTVPVTPPAELRSPTSSDRASLSVEDDGLGGMAPTVTVPGVELARAGQWNAVIGGTQQLGRVEFESMLAADSDGEVDFPALKIGHSDVRFGDGS